MISSFLRKRPAAKKPFGNLASDETLEAFLGEQTEKPSLQEGDIEYVLLLVRDKTPALVGARVGVIADTAVRYGAVVHDLVGSLVVIAFNTLPIKAEQPGGRPALIEVLRKHLGEDLKILHGAGRGHFGLIGSEMRQNFSFILPQFDAMLAYLSQLDFGQIAEFKP